MNTNTNASSTLEVVNVTKSFQSVSNTIQVLKDVSLSLSSGDSLAIVGPSGTGKSTLLHLLGTLDQPDSGSIEIDGINPFGLNETELSHFRNAHIGFIFQDHHLLPHLNVIENVLVPSLAHGKASPGLSDRANELLDSVGLTERATHLPSELSGGERERVAIARALLMNPSLILADEPTGNLDRKTANQVTEVLKSLPEKHGAILIAVTHSQALADALQQRQELVDGRLQPVS
jgi:lipoprotein-releasing system ATP-binding protein